MTTPRKQHAQNWFEGGGGGLDVVKLPKIQMEEIVMSGTEKFAVPSPKLKSSFLLAFFVLFMAVL